MVTGSTKKEVELVIRANDLSAKAFKELVDTFERLKKSQEDLNTAAGEGGRHIRELTGDVNDLEKVAQELASRSGLVDQFHLLEAATDRAGARLELAKQKLVAFNAAQKEGVELTAKEEKRLATLTTQVANAEKAFDKAKGKVAEMQIELDRLGAGGAQKTREEFLKFGADIGASLERAETAVRQYDTVQRESAAKEAEAANVRQAAAKATEESAKRTTGVQRILAAAAAQAATEQADAEAEAAKRAAGVQRILALARAQATADKTKADTELQSGVAFNQQGRDALKAASNIEVLSKDYNALAQSAQKAGDGIRAIVDPGAQALKSLSGLEGEVASFNSELEKVQGSTSTTKGALRLVSGEYTSFSESAGKAAARLADDIGLYRQTDQAVATLGVKVESAAADVRKFGAEMAAAASPSEELAQNLKASKATLAGATAEFDKQSTTLARLRADLHAAGVDTANLGDAEKRLEGVARNLAKSQEALGISTGKAGFKRLAGDVDLVRERLEAARKIGPQLTDIFTGLQAGQSPLTVLLQQGGQLRDVFGGFGGVLRGFAVLITPVTVAVTALVAVVGVLAAGWFKAFKEQEAFRKSLVLTGNVAGQTADTMERLVKNVAGRQSLTGSSQGEVRDAAQAVVSTGLGRLTDPKNIELATTLTARLAKVMGVDAAQAAQKLAGLAGDDLVSAIVELNKTMNFLTPTQLEQIRLLQRQGKEVDALNLALRAIDAGTGPALKNLEDNLGLVEKALLAISRGAKQVLADILAIGRPDTTQDVLNRLRTQLENQLEALQFAQEHGGSKTEIEGRKRAIEFLNKEMLATQNLTQAKEDEAAAAGEAARKNTEAVEAAKIVQAFKDQTDGANDYDQALKTLTREQEKVFNANKKAQEAGSPGALSDAELQRRFAVQRGRIVNPIVAQQIEAAKGQADFVKQVVDQGQEVLEENYKKGLVDLATYYKDRQTMTALAIKAEIDAKTSEIETLNTYEKGKVGTKGKVEKLQQDINALEVKRTQSASKNTFEAEQTAKALRRQVDSLQSELENLTGDDRRTAMQAIRQWYEDQSKAVAELTGVERERAQATLDTVLNIKVHLVEMQKLRKEADHLNDLRSAAIDVSVGQGALSHNDELKARSEANRLYLDDLQKQADALALVGDTGSDTYKQLQVQIIRLRGETDLLGKELTATFKSAAESFITTFIETRSPQKALQSFGKSLGQSLVKSFTDELATGLAKAIKESFIGDFFKKLIGGNLFSGITSLFTGTKAHTGAVIGVSGGTAVRVNPFDFISAPRYHAGGLPGLRSDEVAAVLRKREEVLSPSDPRNVLNQNKQVAQSSGPLRVEVHPDALHMTLKDWLERELARAGARQ